jgi:hypothetical protein
MTRLASSHSMPSRQMLPAGWRPLLRVPMCYPELQCIRVLACSYTFELLHVNLKNWWSPHPASPFFRQRLLAFKISKSFVYVRRHQCCMYVYSGVKPLNVMHQRTYSVALIEWIELMKTLMVQNDHHGFILLPSYDLRFNHSHRTWQRTCSVRDGGPLLSSGGFILLFFSLSLVRLKVKITKCKKKYPKSVS